MQRVVVVALRFVALAACAAAASGACHGATYPTVDCQQVVWARASDGADVRVIGSWDGYAAPGVSAAPSGAPGWQLAVLRLAPGEYGYEVVVDGNARLDAFQPLTTFHGEREVSLLVAQDCSSPALAIKTATADASGALSVTGAFSAAANGPPLDPARTSVTLDGAPMGGAELSGRASDGSVTIAGAALGPGKHTLVVQAAGADGKSASARVAVWVQPAAETWADAVLYQIVTDRFRGDGGVALAPPPTPGSRAGGTLAGITAEIERGTFTDLGVTALWISPAYTNPDEALPGADGHLSEGYHGYWPIADRTVEPRIGGEAALDALVAAAHGHGLRVLFDLVPNHVYEKNPRYLAHTNDGWFNDGPDRCMCGQTGCDWATHILTCWFAPYLPDVRWQSDAAMHDAMDTALFWTSRFDADGVRIDAVPMMDCAATRRIVRALRDSEAPAGALFSVGEVFTGGGDGSIDVIKYYLGKDGLDSAFDFPLMWAMQDAIGTDGAGFDAVEATLAATEASLAGSGAVTGRMLDNHDTARFLSVASGASLASPWDDPPPQPASGDAYARQRLALALVFALPGMPVVYYGDEVALAGASDPDSRRVMPALDALAPEQAQTLALTKRLGALRRCLPSLRRGARVPVWNDALTLAFARDDGDDAPALALFSRARAPAMVTIPGGVVPDGSWVDAVTGAPFSLSGATTVALDPLSFKILIPSASPCRP